MTFCKDRDMAPCIVVVGSLNLDLVVRLERFPLPGETIMGIDLERNAGGKGMNQAMAAARLDAPVHMVGAVGDDEAGPWLVNILQDAKIGTTGIAHVPGNSGTAIIEVESTGENRIVVIPGANHSLTAAAVRKQLLDLTDVAIVLTQAEVPLDVISTALEAGREIGATTIFNPAPVHDFDSAIYPLVDFIVPNEHEAAILTGMETETSVDATEAAQRLNDMGCRTAIITRGEKGCVWSSGANTGSVPAFRVAAIDTVAAGDAFCGGLAAALLAGEPTSEALRWASATAALATTRHGAVPSLPDRASVEEMLA
jgi:ribokinase